MDILPLRTMVLFLFVREVRNRELKSIKVMIGSTEDIRLRFDVIACENE